MHGACSREFRLPGLHEAPAAPGSEWHFCTGSLPGLDIVVDLDFVTRTFPTSPPVPSSSARRDARLRRVPLAYPAINRRGLGALHRSPRCVGAYECIPLEIFAGSTEDDDRRARESSLSPPRRYGVIFQRANRGQSRRFQLKRSRPVYGFASRARAATRRPLRSDAYEIPQILLDKPSRRRRFPASTPGPRDLSRRSFNAPRVSGSNVGAAAFFSRELLKRALGALEIIRFLESRSAGRTHLILRSCE